LNGLFGTQYVSGTDKWRLPETFPFFWTSNILRSRLWLSEKIVSKTSVSEQ